MRLNHVIAAILVTFLLIGCAPDSNSESEAINQAVLSDQVANLSAQVETLQKQLSGRSYELDRCADDIRKYDQLYESCVQERNSKNVPETSQNSVPECPDFLYPFDRENNSDISEIYYNFLVESGWELFLIGPDGVGVRGHQSGGLHCRAGILEGENRNHYYCTGVPSEYLQMQDIIGEYRSYISKTVVEGDGTIGPTVRYDLKIEFDENWEYLGTICAHQVDKFGYKLP